MPCQLSLIYEELRKDDQKGGCTDVTEAIGT